MLNVHTLKNLIVFFKCNIKLVVKPTNLHLLINLQLDFPFSSFLDFLLFYELINYFYRKSVFFYEI